MTGKREFGGEPTNDPKSAIIWEAFKADTEPPRATRQDQLAAEREQILAAIRKLRDARDAGGGAPKEEEGADFVEQQGGVY